MKKKKNKKAIWSLELRLQSQKVGEKNNKQ